MRNIISHTLAAQHCYLGFGLLSFLRAGARHIWNRGFRIPILGVPLPHGKDWDCEVAARSWDFNVTAVPGDAQRQVPELELSQSPRCVLRSIGVN